RNTAGDRAQTGRLLVRNSLERVDDADHRAEQTHERGRRTDGCQTANAALQFGVYDGFGAIQSALRRFDLFTRNFRADLMRLELLQTGDDDLRQVRLLEPVGNLHCFFELAFAQSAGHGRGKLTRLLTRRAVGHQAIDHDADGVGGHDEQADNDGFR